jgi:radical SAM superfamily enzyme YgiQ (UPF0313 family)
MSNLTTTRDKRVVWIETAQFPHDYISPPNIYTGVNMVRAGNVMAGVLARYGYDTTVISGEQTPLIPEQIAQISHTVCISVLSNSAPYGLLLASQLRALGCTVIMGGFHFAHLKMNEETLASTTAALNHCDYVIRGEGYESLPELLEALQDGGPLNDIGGLSWRNRTGDIQHNKTRKTQQQLCELPLADWTSLVDRDKVRCIGIQGVQGCPRQCEWCAVWPRDGQGGAQKRLGVEQVIAEIRAAQAELPGADHLFLTADNLVADVVWLTALCHAMIEEGIKLPWTCQAETEVLAQNPDLVEIMAAAGCVRVCLGIESVSEAALMTMSKQQNIEHTATAVAVAHRYGIAVHGMFIVGLNGDDANAMRAALNWARKHRLESIQLLCLGDLPGSRLTEREHLHQKAFRPFTGALKQLNWLFLNGHYARLASDTLSLSEVQRASLDGMRQFYRLRRVVSGLLRPQEYVYLAARRRGHGRWESLRQMAWAQIVTTVMRWRGCSSMWAWGRHPLNQAYCDLLRALNDDDEDAYGEALARLTAALPPGWVEQFEQLAPAS